MFVFSESVRERASSHFSMINWSVGHDSIPAVEIPGTAIPGGNETFPVLLAENATGIVALYPEIERLGKIDYTGIDEALLSLLRSVALKIQSKKFDASICRPERPYIASIASFQLQKLPIPESVIYSRPTLLDSGEYSVIFRLDFKNENSTHRNMYVNARASAVSNRWYLDDFVFDGETYAAFFDQN
jgi:hypothetical protein